MYVGDTCWFCDVSRVKPCISHANLDLHMSVMVLCIFSWVNVENFKAVNFEIEIDGTVVFESRIIICRIFLPTSALFQLFLIESVAVSYLKGVKGL